MCSNIMCRHIDMAAAPARRAAIPPARHPAGPPRLACLFVALSAAAGAWPAEAAGREVVEAHDNRRAAGTHDDGTVTIRLRAATGEWRPEGPDGVRLTVDAFGEEGKPLMVPAPLVRVTEGGVVAVSIRNDLAASLRVHGLCARDGGACAPLDVQPGHPASVRFPSGRPGTYHYWATSLGAPMPMRELAGAFVVDPREGADATDRVFVITEWNTLTAAEVADILSAAVPSERFLEARPGLTFVINGLSWPATERLTYRRGEPVRWRILNLSSQAHPMHLHGFYFTVLTTGDGRQDAPVAEGAGARVVTHLLPPGGTMLMRWTPEQEGNWLFHCHIMSHVSPARRLTGGTVPVGAPPAHHGSHADGRHDPGLGMAGMVLGITVHPAHESSHPADSHPAAVQRPLRMVIERTRTADDENAIGVTIAARDGSPDDDRPSSPGPPLVLRQGEPVEITVVNRLAEATSIHWHGLEIESYYDGVHGWSGTGSRTAPMIEPGGSFVVRITPPRAGTFIYHTHLHDYGQLSAGLYGPVIVTAMRGEEYDPAVDHVIVLGRRSASEAAGILQDPVTVVLNGERSPRWTWRAGRRHRVRVINITPDDILIVSVTKGDGLLEWRPVAKDAAAVPALEPVPVPARAKIAVGETYDFELEVPSGRTWLWVEVRSPGGKWQAQGQVLVR